MNFLLFLPKGKCLWYILEVFFEMSFQYSSPKSFTNLFEPFLNRLNEASFQAHPDANVCDVNWKSYVLIGDYSSSAQFYVTFAVFVFLYCIAALLLYLGYTSMYRDSRKLPMIVSKHFLFIQKLYVSYIWSWCRFS